MPDQVMLGPVPISAPLNEAALVQNTALGAILVWRFAKAYADIARRLCPLPLCFLPLPILYHHVSRSAAIGTRPASGLNKFVAKFDKNRDELLGIHDRMLALRVQTVRALALGATQRLIAIECLDATVRPLQSVATPKRTPEKIRPIIKAAEKLGTWTAHLEIGDVARILRVAF